MSTPVLPARLRRLIAGAAVLALVPAACGTADEPSAAAPPGPVLTEIAGLDLGRRSAAHSLSGLAILDDGAAILAVSDRGRRYVGALLRDADGRITGVEERADGRLGGADPAAGRYAVDAEALADLGPDGWLVAFERDHRLRAYGPEAPLLAGPGRPVDLPPGAARLPGNSGIEALARLPDGAFLAIAEAKTGPGFSHPAWIGRPGAWRAFTVAAEPAWAPVDAAALPTGDVLVLERWYVPVLGFRSRLSLVPAPALAVIRAAPPGGTLPVDPVPVAAIEPAIGRDNYEGLAVRPLDDRTLEVLIVSDDNAPTDSQRPILLQYRLDLDALAARLAAATAS